MTRYLTVEILAAFAHRMQVGPVRDIGLLEAAAHRPAASAFGRDAYPDLATKSAALLESITRHLPLVDGNKRLGWAATVALIEINGHTLNPPDEDHAYDLVVGVASGEIGLDASAQTLATWVARPTERL